MAGSVSWQDTFIKQENELWVAFLDILANKDVSVSENFHRQVSYDGSGVLRQYHHSLNGIQNKLRDKNHKDAGLSDHARMEKWGLVERKNHLGFRFKINVLAREVLSYGKFQRIDDLLARTYGMTDWDSEPTAAHELAAVAAMTESRSEGKAKEFYHYGHGEGPRSSKSDRKGEEKFEQLKRTVCRRLILLAPETFSREDRTYDVLFKAEYKGRDALKAFMQAIEGLKETKINLSAIRLEDSKSLSAGKTKLHKYTAINRFILTDERVEHIKQILAFLTKPIDKKIPKYNLGVVKTNGLQRAASAMISYLLTNKHCYPGERDYPKKYLHQHFQDVVVIPCSAYTSKGPRVTYGKMIAMLHAYLYPSQHPDLPDQTLSDEGSFLSFEDTLDLSKASIHDNAREIRSKLKDIRWAMLNRRVLIIFNGLISEEDVEDGTYFTRLGIADNPAVMLIRNLTKPGYSDGYYAKNSGGLETFFQSRILVFANGKASPIEPYTTHTWELDAPNVDLKYLLDGEQENIPHMASLAENFEGLYSDAINHSVFFTASLHEKLIEHQGTKTDLSEFRLAFKKSFESEPDSDAVRQNLVYDLSQSLFASQPLFFVALAFMSITTGGTRPITLARFIDRFVRTCNSIRKSTPFRDSDELSGTQPTSLKGKVGRLKSANAAFDIHHLAEFICQSSSLSVGEYVPEDVLNGWGMTLENWDFPTLLLNALAPFVFMKSNEVHLTFDQYTDESGYANDLLDHMSRFQTNTLGQQSRLKKCAEDNKLLFICELRARTDLRDSLKQLIGPQGLALLHIIVMEESLRAHELLLRHTYWLDESYRQYRYMFQTLLHGFTYLQLAGKQEKIAQHFEMSIPKQHDRLFMYLYAFLFGDLTEDKQRYTMARTFEATSTRIEILNMANEALKAIVFREKPSKRSKLSLKDKLSGFFDGFTKAEVTHELTLSRALSRRREGKLVGPNSAHSVIQEHRQDLQSRPLFTNVRDSDRCPTYRQWLTDSEKLLADVYILAGDKNRSKDHEIRKILSNIIRRALGKQEASSLTEYNQLEAHPYYLEATFSHKIDAMVAFIKRDWADMRDALEEDNKKTAKLIVKKAQPGTENIANRFKTLFEELNGKRHSALCSRNLETMLMEIASEIRDHKNAKLETFSVETLAALSDAAARKAEYLFYIPIKKQEKGVPWDYLLRAYLLFKLADLFRRMIFSRAPLTRKHFINAHSIRANIRLLFKMQTNRQNIDLAERYPGFPDLGNLVLMDEARYLIDSLSLMVGTFQRERPALLVIEAQYCRIRYQNYDHAFKLHTQAERYLSFGAPNLLVAARLFSVRIRLCLEMYERLNFPMTMENTAKYWNKAELGRMMMYDCQRLQQLADTIGTDYWKTNAEYWQGQLIKHQLLKIAP